MGTSQVSLCITLMLEFPLHCTWGLKVSFTSCLVMREDKWKGLWSISLSLARLLVVLTMRLFLLKKRDCLVKMSTTLSAE